MVTHLTAGDVNSTAGSCRCHTNESDGEEPFDTHTHTHNENGGSPGLLGWHGGKRYTPAIEVAWRKRYTRLLGLHGTSGIP